MITPDRIIYEDNHLIAISKECGELVQPDPNGNTALEDEMKQFLKVRDNKPGDAFLGVIHRIDRPVSGVVLFAKTSKALARMNEQIRLRQVEKRYWAVVETPPIEQSAELVHHITRDQKQNKSRATIAPKKDSKEARLKYKTLGASKNYTLLEIELITGRHHQIRAQLSAIGSPIKGDLKYGAKRSNPDGGILLHSRAMSFTHPVTKELTSITAPTSKHDSLWSFFETLKL